MLWRKLCVADDTQSGAGASRVRGCAPRPQAQAAAAKALHFLFLDTFFSSWPAALRAEGERASAAARATAEASRGAARQAQPARPARQTHRILRSACVMSSRLFLARRCVPSCTRAEGCGAPASAAAADDATARGARGRQRRGCTEPARAACAGALQRGARARPDATLSPERGLGFARMGQGRR